MTKDSRRNLQQKIYETYLHQVSRIAYFPQNEIIINVILVRTHCKKIEK